MCHSYYYNIIIIIIILGGGGHRVRLRDLLVLVRRLLAPHARRQRPARARASAARDVRVWYRVQYSIV